MAGRWCCHHHHQFVLLSFRHIGAYHSTSTSIVFFQKAERHRMEVLWVGHLLASERELPDNFDNANLKVSVLLLFTVSNVSRFQIGMVQGMKLFLYG